MECPDCKSENTVKNGKDYEQNGTFQKYICRACKRQFRIELFSTKLITNGYHNTPNKPCNILIFDIEVLPMEVFVWGLYKQRISYKNIIKEWIVLSWAAKWLYEDTVFSDVLTRKEIKKRDDKRILKSIHELFDQADIVVAHNGNRFDIRKLNARWIYHKIKPPAPYKSIDTLKKSQQTLGTSSHKLDYLGKFLVNDEKLDTDFQLWIDCRNGDQQALADMQNYNCKDVLLLEEVYIELLPWIKFHPNIGIYYSDEEIRCSNCGEANIKPTGGYYTTQANQYAVYQCANCGAYARLPKGEISYLKRMQTLRPV